MCLLVLWFYGTREGHISHTFYTDQFICGFGSLIKSVYSEKNTKYNQTYILNLIFTCIFTFRVVICSAKASKGCGLTR